VDPSLFFESIVPISIPTIGCLLIKTTRHELIVLDIEHRVQKRSSLSGLSTQNSIRFINLFDNSLVGVIDCFGQFSIYDLSLHVQEPSLKGIFIERNFSESFSVSISRKLMVLVCPLKLIVYRRQGVLFEPFRTILSPDTTVLWRSVSIFSCTSIVASSNKPGTVWDVSEEDIVELGVEATISHFISGKIFIDEEKKCYYELIQKSKSQYKAFPVGVIADRNESLISRTFASDGPHVFLVDYSESNILVYPLSIQDCFIDLVLPDNCKVTCVSGSVVARRLVIGTTSGSLFVYIVGTSKMETRFETDMLGAVRLIGLIESDGTFFGAIDALGGVHLMEYNLESGELTRRLKMKVNFLLNLTITEYQYSVRLNVENEIVKVEVVDSLNKEEVVYVEEWNLSSKRLMRATTQNRGDRIVTRPICPVLDGCCELESERGSLDESFAEKIMLKKILKKEKDVISNLWLCDKSCWGNSARGVAVYSNSTKTVQVGISSAGSDVWGKLLKKFFLRENCEISINGDNFDFLLNLVEFLIKDDKLKPISCTDTISLISLIIQEITRMIITGFVDLESRINYLIYEQKNRLVYSCIVGIVPRYLKGYSSAVSVVSDTIATEEEVRRKTSLISAITSRRQSVVTVISEDENILFNVEMAREIFASFTNDVRMSQLPILLTMKDSFGNLKKLAVERDLVNNFFFTIYSLVSDEDDKSVLSSIAIDILTSIGFNNSIKFAKRLAAMIKAKHNSVVPLMLVRKMMERYARHSIRILPMLMEIVILPCLDSLDYRLRKISIQPTTEVFKSMNKLFPMTAFHQNRQKFAIGSTQGQVFVYDIRSATKWRVLDGHTGAISAVGFDPSGKHICTYSATDCTVRVWFLASGGVASAGPVVVSGTGGAGSVLSGLLGTTGGKCIQVKQLGATDQDDRSGIKHPFTLIHRIQSVKIRWTSEADILLMRENGEGAQIKI
jgi:hypothetical protein